MTILTAVYWFLIATLFAYIEIEIEGKYGWSEKTQTWFRSAQNRPQWINLFLGKKPLTGYHLFLFPLVLLLAHAHFFMGASWSLVSELRALALYFLWSPLWDYLWFVYNPHYDIQKLKAVWWYKTEYLVVRRIPLSTCQQWAISFILVGVGTVLTGNRDFLVEQLMTGAIFIVGTLGSLYFVAPLYKKWYLQMRLSDDRSDILR